MKVPPFYSADPAALEIFHDAEACELGQQIPLNHRRLGMKRRDRCRRCKEIPTGPVQQTTTGERVNPRKGE